MKPRGRPTPASRRPLLAWAREIPIAGHPADVGESLTRGVANLAAAGVPALLLHGQPGAVVSAQTVTWLRDTVPGLAVVDVGNVWPFPCLTRFSSVRANFGFAGADRARCCELDLVLSAFSVAFSPAETASISRVVTAHQLPRRSHRTRPGPRVQVWPAHRLVGCSATSPAPRRSCSIWSPPSSRSARSPRSRLPWTSQRPRPRIVSPSSGRSAKASNTPVQGAAVAITCCLIAVTVLAGTVWMVAGQSGTRLQGSRTGGPAKVPLSRAQRQQHQLLGPADANSAGRHQ